jgi:DNA processing protein
MAELRWTRREILFALHETAGIGRVTIRRIIENGALTECPSFGEAEWRAIGLTAAQASAVRNSLTPAFLRERAALYAREGIAWIGIEDEGYPKLLKAIADPPWMLYAIGRLDLLEALATSVVGTRMPTAYGRQTARTLAEQLSASGVTVVSGLARGIDACAHEGGLRGPGSTIAVLGTSIGTIYPPQHASLYHAIAQGGLIVSEYPLGTISHPGLFPQRNRIIAGLSRGTIVVEAAEQSGSLITAELAMGYNREVYAVPGMINSGKSSGTHRLIKKNGATLLTSYEEILLDLYGTDGRHVLAESNASERPASLSSEEQFIVDLLRDEPLHSDQLLALTGFAFGHLHALLINLSIKRRIEQHPGSLYSAI